MDCEEKKNRIHGIPDEKVYVLALTNHILKREKSLQIDIPTCIDLLVYQKVCRETQNMRRIIKVQKGRAKYAC